MNKRNRVNKALGGQDIRYVGCLLTYCRVICEHQKIVKMQSLQELRVI